MAFIVLGGTSLDVFLEGMPRLPTGRAGVDEFTSASLVHVKRPPITTIGGNAGNAAAALGRLGASVRLVSSWADDVAGRRVATWLGDVGCAVHNLGLTASTALNVTATADDGTRLTFFHGPALPPGCGAALCDATPLGRGDVLLLAGYPHPAAEDLAHVAEDAKRNGATVALDLGPATAGLTAERLGPLLPHLDLLLGSEREVTQLAHDAEPQLEDAMEPRLSETIERLAAQLPAALVVKRGARGAGFRSSDAGAAVDVPAHAVEARTTVGAGDAFNAGFLYAWGAGAQVEEALRFGCAVAAEALEGGGALSLPHADRVRGSHVRDADGPKPVGTTKGNTE